MSDEVSAQDDEEAEQDEDNYSNHPSDHGVVHPRRRRHGCGVLRRGGWDGEERRGACSKDKIGDIMRERGKGRLVEKQRVTENEAERVRNKGREV